MKTLDSVSSSTPTHPTAEIAKAIFEYYPDIINWLRDMRPNERLGDMWFSEPEIKQHLPTDHKPDFVQGRIAADKESGQEIFSTILEKEGINYFANLGFIVYRGLRLENNRKKGELTRKEYDILLAHSTIEDPEFTNTKAFHYAQQIFKLSNYDLDAMMGYGNSMKDIFIHQQKYNSTPTPEQIAYMDGLKDFLPPELSKPAKLMGKIKEMLPKF